METRTVEFTFLDKYYTFEMINLPKEQALFIDIMKDAGVEIFHIHEKLSNLGEPNISSLLRMVSFMTLIGMVKGPNEQEKVISRLVGNIYKALVKEHKNFEGFLKRVAQDQPSIKERMKKDTMNKLIGHIDYMAGKTKGGD